jgi:hypothetical protein
MNEGVRIVGVAVLQALGYFAVGLVVGVPVLIVVAFLPLSLVDFLIPGTFTFFMESGVWAYMFWACMTGFIMRNSDLIPRRD